MEKDKNNTALLFVGLTVSEEERFRVAKEIEKVGGLSFGTIEKSENGWLAQCKEIPAIVAGNANPSPTNPEIETEIRQAIIAAFDIKIEEQAIKSPFKFQYGGVSNNSDK